MCSGGVLVDFLFCHLLMIILYTELDTCTTGNIEISLFGVELIYINITKEDNSAAYQVDLISLSLTSFEF